MNSTEETINRLTDAALTASAANYNALQEAKNEAKKREQEEDKLTHDLLAIGRK